MPPTGGVPILGTPTQVNSGQEYAVLLTTTDGDEHVAAMTFNAPTQPGGGVDLKAIADFNPEEQAMRIIGTAVLFAHRLPVPLPKTADGQVLPPPMLLECEGRRQVVPAHVVSFRYLGAITQRVSGMVVVNLNGVRSVYSTGADPDRTQEAA